MRCAPSTSPASSSFPCRCKAWPNWPCPWSGGSQQALRFSRKGMWMRDAGIMDGDLLAVQISKDVRNGQIVVARLGEEVTVKRFRRNKHLIELHPENPDFQTIIVEPGEPFEIEGLAVGLIRNTMLM